MESGSIVHEFIAAFQSSSHSGPWMVTLVILLGVCLGLTIERVIRVFFQYSVNANSFMLEIQKYILANDIDGAIRLCNGAGKSALPKIIKAGLQKAAKGPAEIQLTMEAAGFEVIPKLEQRITYLSLIAQLATLVGLLGTIAGLIQSFGALSIADPAQRQMILGGGLSEALSTTAFGIIIAILSLTAHGLISHRTSMILGDIDEFSAKLLDLLATRNHSTSNS